MIPKSESKIGVYDCMKSTVKLEIKQIIALHACYVHV